MSDPLIPIPRKVWVTVQEFSRVMGKSEVWAKRAIYTGMLPEAGISVLATTPISRGGRGRMRWYLQIPVDLL